MPEPQHAAAPDPRTYASLVDVLEDAARRYPQRVQFSLRTDAGISLPWSAAELSRRSKLAAWRLRALGLAPGDRLLTWSPSTPELPALYFGAMRAGVTVVPLDLRMASGVVQRIADRAKTNWLAVGSGLDAPDPGAAGVGHLRTRTVAWFTSEPSHQNAAGTDEGGLDEAFPAEWERQVDSWPRPTRSDLFETIYTSGSTGDPKGAALTHGNILSMLEAFGRILPPRHHRVVSVLPLSHLFEQAPVLFYGLMIGAEVLYVRSRNPRIILTAVREHRPTTMVLTPQILDLLWASVTREVERQGKEATFRRARRVARRLPYAVRRWIFRRVHAQLGGELRVWVVAGAFLPPALQEGWEDLGTVVLQGYGATECGPASATSERDHPTGRVGKTVEPVRLRLAESDGEIMVAGPTVFQGYAGDPAATAAALEPDGWYHTGDIGRFDERGNLVLTGRKKNIIVLPSGLNVYPEDVENALLVAGLAHAVVVESAPGRIEAVVLPPGTPPIPTPSIPPPRRPESPEEEAALRREIDALVATANRTLSTHQRVDAWRLWPDPDFPRTHTLKVRRDDVRRWAVSDEPLPVREEATALG